MVFADIDRNKFKSDQEIDEYYGASLEDRGALSQRKALAGWRQKILECRTLPSEEAIPILASAVSKIPKYSIFQSAERIAVFDLARNDLMALPRHAEHLANQIRIERAKNAVENERRVKNGDKPLWGSYDNVRMRTMQTLEHIPSPEVVKVLGEFLQDNEETQKPIRVGYVPDSYGPGSNASLAAEALRKLIENPPVPKDQSYQLPGAIPAWQSWYEQIKSGNRTFRFEGDPVEYDLNGPAPKEKLAHIERHRKRDAERVAGERRSAPVIGSVSSEGRALKPAALAGIVAACLAFLAAGAYWRKRSRAC